MNPVNDNPDKPSPGGPAVPRLGPDGASASASAPASSIPPASAQVSPGSQQALDPRGREQRTRRWRRGLLAALAAVAVIAALVWAFAPQPVEVELAEVTEGPFETSVEEDGKTRLRDRYVVSAPLAGQLDRIALREGDEVRADQVVATLTPVLPPMQDERTLREQQLRVEVAEAAAQRAAARVEVVRAALQKARSEAERSEQLARQDFISPLRLEADRLAVQAAQGELEAALQERHVAGHEIEQARAALIVASRPAAGAPRRFALSSPIAGKVLRVVQASEGNVALGTPLLELGDTARLEVVAELLTTDALQARPGSRVLIERWGGPGVLEGRVRRVEPAAFTKVSALGVEEQRVRVLLDLASPAAQWQALGDGYRVGVRIVTLALPRVVKVPVGAVFPLPAAGGGAGPSGGASPASDSFGVFVVEGGRARLRRVELGARNGGEAWIREGLPAGVAVIVYPASTVRDGVRVHAHGG